jgi:hypothetical protein
MTQHRVPLSQAAAVLGVTPGRLRRLCAQGRVHGARRETDPTGRHYWTVLLFDGVPRIDEARDDRPSLGSWRSR